MNFDLAEMVCGECGIEFRVPHHFKNERLKTGGQWFCPNGHSRVYKETLTDKYKREADLAKQQLAQKDDEIRYERERADKAERKTKRVQKRANAGVCQCCNRTFTNVALHMKTKHPEISHKPVLKCAS